MKTLKKIKQARDLIRSSSLKKEGRNEFSKYSYFTPEQISNLVSNACDNVGLINKFDLLRTELGLVANLTIYDIDSGKNVSFQMATEIPQIKATNTAQQLGGCVTYSERYLLQVAYDIKDNNLDFDNQKTEKSSVSIKKPALSDSKYSEAMDKINGMEDEIDRKDAYKYLDDKFSITDEYRENLLRSVNEPLKLS